MEEEEFVGHKIFVAEPRIKMESSNSHGEENDSYAINYVNVNMVDNIKTEVKEENPPGEQMSENCEDMHCEINHSDFVKTEYKTDEIQPSVDTSVSSCTRTLVVNVPGHSERILLYLGDENPTENFVQNQTSSLNKNNIYENGKSVLNTSEKQLIQVKKSSEKHLESRKYKCQMCSKRFVRKYSLKCHINKNHKGIIITDTANTEDEEEEKREKFLIYECADCCKTFSDLTILRRHSRVVHSGKKYICDECGKRFSNSVKLKVHVSRHIGIKYKCDQCGKLVSSPGCLKLHIDTMHRNKTFVCDTCGKKYPRSYMLVNHINIAHKGINTNNNYKCNYCDKLLSSSVCLREHINGIHKKLKNYTCDSCGKRYINLRNLKLHINVQHNCNSSFICHICGTMRYNSTSLKGHINRVHGRATTKNYQCSFCNRMFYDPKNIEKHINLVHSGTGGFKCEQCGKIISTAFYLKVHIKQVHGKSIKCHVCNSVFSELSSLTTHVNTMHSDITDSYCVECGKVLCNKKYLKNHIKKVHREKINYICDICNKTFLTFDEIKQHINFIHCGFSDFQCNICGKFTANIRSLKRHKSMIHSNISANQ